MKLWQGWRNTDLGRSYFHYGPLGGTKKQMGILAQTCKKRGVKSTGKKEKKSELPLFPFKSTQQSKICQNWITESQDFEIRISRFFEVHPICLEDARVIKVP